MGSFFTLLLIYLLGGLTFLPLTLCALLLHAHLTFPYVPPAAEQDGVRDASDDGRNIRSGPSALEEKAQRNNDKESGGYFAVCREWVPGGVNGKPPERTTPAGEVIAEESPSVYQSMYRSLFDRKQAPTMDVSRSNGGKAAKKARNVFYIVLRHGHLMLYDDTEQVEVRHVISLALHDVGVYAGGEEIPEGELWIKRNAICLTRKTPQDSMLPASKPFYLYSENCSEKEDFYFALLQNQERDSNDPHPPPLIQHFEVKHIISLVQRLHSSEEQLQTRWINALIGRLFLGIYKTQEVENFVRMKITKKISRVKKPAFLSGIVLQKVDLGEAAPFITNPRLKDLTVEGDCCAEADIKYEGNFRMEIATTAKIDLGTRFKAREVNLVLAITMKRLEGHLLVRLKPPPSNRIWISFETMPQLEMDIEPIVSSRQITYSIILRAIESRIREVFAETLVLPHWDDSPFLSTLNHHFRGGIWVNERRDFQPPTENVVPDDEPDEGAEADDATIGVALPAAGEERSMSAPPATADAIRPILMSRKSERSQSSLGSGDEKAASTSIQRAPEISKAIRPRSFLSTAGTVVSTDSVKSDPVKPDSKLRQPQDAASLMTEISNRSQPGSPGRFPSGSRDSRRSSMAEKDLPDYSISYSSKSSRPEPSPSKTTLAGEGSGNGSGSVTSAPSRASTMSLGSKSLASGLDAGSHSSTKLQSVARSLTPSEKKQQTLSAAAVAAKNWGWKTLTKGKNAGAPSTSEKRGTPEHPLGRGRPLPPPGQPLPPPDKRGSSSSFTVPKRKPVAPPALPDRPSQATTPGLDAASAAKLSNGIEDHRRRDEASSDGILVVEVPEDSGPGTEDDEDGYGEYIDNVKAEPEGYDTMDELPTPTPTPVASGEVDSEVANKKETGGQEEEFSQSKEALSPLPRPGSDTLTASYYEGESWQSAQELEARSKSVWMDEQEQ